MNNDDVIADLKQFITATVSQQLSQQTTELKAELRAELKTEIGGMKAELQELRQEMRDGFAGVADAMEPIQAAVDDHEARIAKLEPQTA